MSKLKIQNIWILMVLTCVLGCLNLIYLENKKRMTFTFLNLKIDFLIFA
jgi:hypothetical protein